MFVKTGLLNPPQSESRVRQTVSLFQDYTFHAVALLVIPAAA